MRSTDSSCCCYLLVVMTCNGQLSRSSTLTTEGDVEFKMYDLMIPCTDHLCGYFGIYRLVELDLNDTNVTILIYGPFLS